MRHFVFFATSGWSIARDAPRWTRGAAVVSACILGACAHRGGPPTVERRIGDATYRGTAYTAGAYRAAMEFELAPSIDAHAADAGVPSAGLDPRFVVLTTEGDPHVLALALERAPSDVELRRFAEARQRTSPDCDVGIALAAHGPTPVVSLSALIARCPRATARAIEVAIARDDDASLPALARLAAPSSDPRVVDAAFDAFVHLADTSGLERFVATHQGEPTFVRRALDRASETSDASVRAAILAPLVVIPRCSVDAIRALVEAHRTIDATDALARVTPTSLDDRLALAELAITVGDAARALAWLDSAYAEGASTRALSLRVRALVALGRADEAARVDASIRAETAGALDRD